jgi:hypothetical protein
MSKSLLILIILVSTYLTCCKETPSNNSLNDNSKPDSVFTVSQDSVLIGSKFSVKVIINDSAYRINNVVFTDSCIVYPDSISYPYSYFTVPFLAKSGNLIVLSNLNKIAITKVTVVDSYAATLMNMDWYDLPTPIPLKDTCYYDVNNNPCLWTSEIIEDTIRLTLNYSSHFNLYKKELVFIDQGENQLPKFVRYIFTDIDDTYTRRIDTVNAGYIKIQNWSSNSTVYGQIYYTKYYPGTIYSQESLYFTFYYKYK